MRQDCPVRIGMLGSFEVQTGDGTAVEVPGARLRALLAALALEPGRIVARARLVDWVWGEEPPADAVNALQVLVSRLRKVLPDGVVEAKPGGYQLTVDPDAVDVSRFERLVAAARTAADDPERAELLRSALALWRGAPMDGIALQGSRTFDAAVSGLVERHLAVLGDRVDLEVRLGGGADLVSELTDLVARYPLREGLVAALMRALAQAGRGAEALTAYQQLAERLADELGVDPSAELSALHTALLRGEIGGRAENRRTNLRAELTTFVGKEDDVAEVAALAARHRLVTLTGAGGSGKTRLATETARTMLGDLPDGAWLVELAPLRAGSEPAQATLTALGLRDQSIGGGPGGDAMDRLVAALRERVMLLVLDNCERTGCWGSAGGCGSWPPAGSRSASRARRCGRSSRSRCPRRMRARRRPGPRPRCGCCGTGPRRYAATSAPTSRPWRPWSGSAGRWTGCRWRSNWPRPGCARCRWISSRTASTTASSC
jgi:DNA-binding SARP family transcriptional activator